MTKIPTMEFSFDNMPSPALMIIHPQIAKACYRAYYEHHKANKSALDFKYTYTMTEDDLRPYM